MRYIVSLILLLSAFSVRAQQPYFPPLVGNAWDTISPQSLGWCPEPVEEMMDWLEGNNTKAFILLKDGKIVIERYFGTFTQDSIWYWASAGKTLTAFMVGIAQQEGHLSISDTTSQYLGQGWTSCSPEEEEKITIRHQLTMTTGLNDGVPDHYCTLSSCLECIAEPGTRWAYHNGPYTLLDGVIANATGQTLNSYTVQKLSQPTGIVGAFYPVDYNNVFFSKPRSMARFGLLMQNGGVWNGNPVMTDATYFNDMVNTSQQLNESYGYLWWLNGKPTAMVPGSQLVFPGPMCPSAPDDMYAALGKNGQIINVAPSTGITFIRMGNAPGAGEVPLFFNDTIWQKLNALECIPTGLGELSERELRLYPNPTSGMLRVVSHGELPLLEVTDLRGKTVIAPERTDMLDLSGLKAGIYLVRADGVQVQRVVRVE